MGILRYPARVKDPIAHDLTVESAEVGVIGGLVFGIGAAAVVILTVVSAGADLPVLAVIAGVAGAGAGGGSMTSLVYGFTEQPKDKIKGVIEEGSSNVKIEGKRAARVGDGCLCQDHGHDEKLRTGCREVLVNLRPLVRVLDETDHEGLVTDGAHSVLVGGSTYSFGESASALEGTAVETVIDTLALTSAVAEGGELAAAANIVLGEIAQEGARALEKPEVQEALREMAKKGYNVSSYVAEQIAKHDAGEDRLITKVLQANAAGRDLSSPIAAIKEGKELAEQAEHASKATRILSAAAHH